MYEICWKTFQSLKLWRVKKCPPGIITITIFFKITFESKYEIKTEILYCQIKQTLSLNLFLFFFLLRNIPHPRHHRCHKSEIKIYPKGWLFMLNTLPSIQSMRRAGTPLASQLMCKASQKKCPASGILQTNQRITSTFAEINKLQNEENSFWLSF